MLLSFALLRLDASRADGARTRTHPMLIRRRDADAPVLIRRRDTDAPRARTHPMLIRRRDADAFPDPRSPIVDLARLPVAAAVAAAAAAAAAGSAASSAPYLHRLRPRQPFLLHLSSMLSKSSDPFVFWRCQPHLI